VKGALLAKSPQLTESRRTLTVQGVFRETHSPKSLKTSEKGNLMKLKWRKDDYIHIKNGRNSFFQGGIFKNSLLNMLPIRRERGFLQNNFLKVYKEFANI